MYVLYLCLRFAASSQRAGAQPSPRRRAPTDDRRRAVAALRALENHVYDIVQIICSDRVDVA